MAACWKTETEECLMARQETENSVVLLVWRIQLTKTPSSKGAFVAHPAGEELRCASSKRPGSLGGGATDLSLRLDLPFCGGVGMAFTLSCVAPTKDVCHCIIYVDPNDSNGVEANVPVG